MNFYWLLAAIFVFSFVSAAKPTNSQVLNACKSMSKFVNLGEVYEIEEEEADMASYLDEALDLYALLLSVEKPVVLKYFQGRSTEQIGKLFEYLAEHMYTDATAEQANKHLGNAMDGKHLDLLTKSLSRLQSNFKIVNMLSFASLLDFAKIVESDFDPENNLKLKKQVAFEFDGLENTLSLDRKAFIEKLVKLKKALTVGGKYTEEELKQLEANTPLELEKLTSKNLKKAIDVYCFLFRIGASALFINSKQGSPAKFIDFLEYVWDHAFTDGTVENAEKLIGFKMTQEHSKCLKESFEKLQMMKNFSGKYLKELAESIKYKFDPESESNVKLLKINIARMQSKDKIQKDHSTGWYYKNLIPIICMILLGFCCVFGVVMYYRKKSKSKNNGEEVEDSMDL